MTLTWYPSETPDDLRMHPHGYWVARTDDRNHDGDGPDPLTAVSALVTQMEREHR